MRGIIEVSSESLRRAGGGFDARDRSALISADGWWTSVGARRDQPCGVHVVDGGVGTRSGDCKYKGFNGPICTVRRYLSTIWAHLHQERVSNILYQGAYESFVRANL